MRRDYEIDQSNRVLDEEWRKATERTRRQDREAYLNQTPALRAQKRAQPNGSAIPSRRRNCARPFSYAYG